MTTVLTKAPSLIFTNALLSFPRLAAKCSPMTAPRQHPPSRFQCKSLLAGPNPLANTYPSLVVIEMLNAMNALSSSESLLTLPLWENMILVYAITLSMVLHFLLLYIPFLQGLFSIVPLNWSEWQAVLLISIPVM